MTQAPETITPQFSAWNELRRPIWIFDPVRLQGVYANRAALALWGAESLEELLGRDFSQLSTAVRTRVERLAEETASGAALNERWTFYPNGQPVTVQATISSVSIGEGRRALLFEASSAEVEPGERRAVEALRHTATSITLFDEAGTVLFANPAAFAAYGAGDHEFAARFADPAEGALLWRSAMAGEDCGAICEAETRAGRRWHHFRIRKVLDPVTGAGGVLLDERDVTERVEAERARAAAEQRVAMSEARQQFLTDMSHELRTPLNAVIGFSELLQASGLPEDQMAQLRRIHEAGHRLAAVVEQMIEQADIDDWAPHAPEPADKAVAAPEEAGADAVRVLYVDDNDSNRALIKAVLTAQGALCETANDGAEGVEAARDGRWDLILMDIRMPVMDGVAATRAIRALPGAVATTPIIALTANTLPEEVAGYREAGMDDCLGKPVELVALMTVVANWCERRHEPARLAG